MKFIHHGDTLNITEVNELSARNCDRFRSELEPLLPSSKRIRIDLSATDFMDCRGVSALLALQRLGCGDPAARSLTVLNPNRRVRRIIGLTGLDRMVPVDEPLLEQVEHSDVALSAIAAALNPGQMPLTISVTCPVGVEPAQAPAALPARLSVADPDTAIPLPATPPSPSENL